MKLIKANTSYKVMYTKEEAIKHLLRDDRVESVETYFEVCNGSFISKKINDKNGNEVVFITTKPILPKVTKKINLYTGMFDNIFLTKVGRYQIKLYKSFGFNYLNAPQIIRINYGIKKYYMHRHINSEEGNVCWGTANEDIYTICQNNDWFWLGKLSLDLLEDGDSEGVRDEYYFEVWCKLQKKYCDEIGDKETFNKLKEMEEKYKAKFNYDMITSLNY